MPEISESKLQELKDEIEKQKSKVLALTEEKDNLVKEKEKLENDNKTLAKDNTDLRLLNGKLLLKQEQTDKTEPETETELSLEEQVEKILKGE